MEHNGQFILVFLSVLLSTTSFPLQTHSPPPTYCALPSYSLSDPFSSIRLSLSPCPQPFFHYSFPCIQLDFFPSLLLMAFPILYLVPLAIPSSYPTLLLPLTVHLLLLLFTLSHFKWDEFLSYLFVISKLFTISSCVNGNHSI